MAKKEMKSLTIRGTTYEIVDKKAREDIEELKIYADFNNDTEDPTVEISNKEKVKSIDFSSLENGYFSIVLADNTTAEFRVIFDEDTGRPVEILNNDGVSLEIKW